MYTVSMSFLAVGVTEEKTVKKTIAAVQVSTTGITGTGGLVPACAASSHSCGTSVLAPPNEWSHGAHWYRSSAILLKYHK